MADDFERFVIRHDLKSAGGDPSAGVTNAQLVEFAASVGEFVGTLVKRIGALEKQQVRLDHLEKNALQWRGDWKPGIFFPASAIVRHAGGLFVALTETTQAPGAAGAPWSQI